MSDKQLTPMKTLEEYKQEQAEQYPYSYEDHSCQPDNHCHDCPCANDEEGFKAGFDACLELELPVKLNLWLVNLRDGNPHEVVRIYKEIGVEEATIEQLYTYWITHILKLE